MPLKITRAVDSVVYGGRSLNPDRLEDTFDHRIWTRRVRNTEHHQDCILNIQFANQGQAGTVEQIFSVQDEGVRLASDVSVKMAGITEHITKPSPYCPECGRGDLSVIKNIPQAKLAITAPRDYLVVRHDARRKV